MMGTPGQRPNFLMFTPEELARGQKTMTTIILRADPLYRCFEEGKTARLEGFPIFGNPYPRPALSEQPRKTMISAWSQWELGWSVEDAAIRDWRDLR